MGRRGHRFRSAVCVAAAAWLGIALSCQTVVVTDGNPTSQPDDSGGPAFTVSFAQHIQPIFNSYCIRCHVTGGFAAQSGIPLRLTEGESYARLVGVHSAQRPDLTLVLPHDPDNSLLYLKITQNPPPVGRHMPWDGGPGPNADETQQIRTWIAEGAENN